jgi:translation initiation factor IF-3
MRSFSSLNCVMEGRSPRFHQPHLQQQQQQQHRTFASPRRKPNQKGTPPPLANEKLIKVLMKRASNPKDVSVRVVIDEDQNPDSPNVVQVISLAEAIKLSVERDLDLIAATLDSDPPTIRCTQLSKLLYKREQSQKQNSQQQSKRQQQKTFRFKAGIGDADLERKVKDMNKFLQQGLECEYTVFTKRFIMRSNINAGNELSDRVQELVAEHGVLKREPQTNETGNRLQCVLEPKKK